MAVSPYCTKYNVLYHMYIFSLIYIRQFTFLLLPNYNVRKPNIDLKDSMNAVPPGTSE